MLSEEMLADLASRIIARFLNMGLPSPRHGLAVIIRDAQILDEMETQCLLRAEMKIQTDSSKKEYFPTLGTFALLSDDDARLETAHVGVVRVLTTLTNLYETRDPSTNYSLDELIGHVQDRYDRTTIDPKQISLGLDLSVTEFGAISSFARSEDGARVIRFMIAERALNIADPEAAWSERIVLSRQNATKFLSRRNVGAATTPFEAFPLVSDYESTGEQAAPMDDGELENIHPRVFLSYSWDTREHQDWVKALGTRLRSDGVNVILDEWDLGLGHNRFLFMEKIATVDSVVIVCTPKYAEKANRREAGVGYESNIITSGIAEKTGHRNFIPVLRSGTWETALPVWLKHVRGADLRGDGYSERQYRNLLRTLHRRNPPAPPIGPIPDFSDDDQEPSEEFVSSFQHSVAGEHAVGPMINQPIKRAITVQRSVTALSADDDLNPREVELLSNAAKSSDGLIYYSSTLDGEGIRASERQFLSGADARTASEWLSALHGLENRGFLEPLSADRDLFKVTGDGYSAADQLEEFARWDAHSITLRANYMNADSKEFELSCEGIVALPATYYPDQIGVDGFVQRSLKEPRSLLVEGLDAVPSIDWQPTDVEFKDGTTETVQSFRVDGMHYIRPGRLKLPIAG
jgi:hypothetical protein